jgi:hypothetical protein
MYIWKLLYMFRVVFPPIIRSAHNCIYSIWYLSHRYCYLPLSWKSWNRFECAVVGVQSLFELLRTRQIILLKILRILYKNRLGYSVAIFSKFYKTNW